MPTPHRLIQFTLAPLAAVAAVSACGQPSETSTTATEATTPAHSWTIFRGDPKLTGVAAGALPDDVALLWTFEAESAIVSSPAVWEGHVYFGSDDGNLYAVEIATGERAWAFKTEDIIEAPPLVHDGVVYIGSSDFFFYAVDAKTGELKWKYETDDKVLGGANLVQTSEGLRIVVGSYDNKLYCFDLAGGDPKWIYETDNYVNGTPAVSGNRVIFGGCDAVLHVVDGATGKPTMKVPLGEEAHVAGSVAIADDRVYFGHYANAFVCVDLNEEAVDWSYPSRSFGFFSSPSIVGDRIVFGGRDKKLHCAKRADGEPIWTVKTRRKVDGSPVVCGDKVVFGSGDGRMYIVRLDDGEELWSYEIGQSIFSSPAVADGVILIGANDGRLYAFGDAAKAPTTDDDG